MKTGTLIRSAQGVTVTALIAASLAACGSGSNAPASASDGSSCSIPSTINLTAIKDQTGLAAATGIEAWRGIQLAQDDINNHGVIKGAKVDVSLKDPAGSAQTAASDVTAAIADTSVAAILGPVLSDQAQAVSPLADRGKIPVVYTQAGSKGVVTEQYNFRATPPLDTLYPKVGTYLKSKGVKNVGVIYSSDIPTLAELGTTVIDDLGKKNGFKVSNSVSVTATTQDLTTPVAKATQGNPDAIALMMAGTQVASAAQKLEQAGFKGTVVTYPAAAAGLAQIGAAAAGAVWPTNFDASVDTPEAQKFVKAFSAKFDGKSPTNYAAEAYDSLMWVAKAINAEKCASRDAIKAGLEKVGKSGFTGLQGALTFADNGHDARSPGLLVTWTGTKVEVVQGQ